MVVAGARLRCLHGSDSPARRRTAFRASVRQELLPTRHHAFQLKHAHLTGIAHLRKYDGKVAKSLEPDSLTASGTGSLGNDDLGRDSHSWTPSRHHWGYPRAQPRFACCFVSSLRVRFHLQPHSTQQERSAPPDLERDVRRQCPEPADRPDLDRSWQRRTVCCRRPHHQHRCCAQERR